MLGPAKSVSSSIPVAAGRGGLREVGRLAWPAVLSQLSITAMSVVDTAMVGRLGATELAAVGFAGMWVWTFLCFFAGTTSGLQTFVAQHHGAGEERRCGAWAWQALFVMLPATLLGAAGFAFAAAPLLDWLDPSAAMQAQALDYLRVRLVGTPAFVLASVWMAFFRGVGDTRTPLVAVLVANLVNAVVAYGSIFGELGFPRLGVVGAGVGTACGEWVCALFLLVASQRARVRLTYATEARAPGGRDARRLLRVGVPIGGQWVIDMGAFALFTTLVARMGDASMAASQAFMVLLSLSFMQAVGISVAASTLVGRYIGAGDYLAARRSFRSALVFAALLAIAVAVLFLAAPEAMIALFSSDPEVQRLGAPLVRLGALYQLLDAAAIVAGSALRGAGDTRWPFFVQTGLAWCVFLPCAYVGAVLLDGGLTGAWLGALVSVGGMAILYVRRFTSGSWEQIRI